MTDPSDAYKYTVIDTSEWEPGVGPLPGPDDKPEVVELAELLPRLASLTAFVNSDRCSDHDRQRLRELVPGGTYYLLLCNLADLRSTLARQIRRINRRPNQLTIDLLRFFDDYNKPATTKRPDATR